MKLLATGAQRKTEVYFKGTLLGEVHEKFGVSTDTFVNTTSNTATKKLLHFLPLIGLKTPQWKHNA